MKSFMICTPRSDAVWVITSRGKRWAGHVTHVDEKMNAYSGLMGKPDGRSHLEDLDIGGRMIL
jgi:hypothetical protein